MESYLVGGEEDFCPACYASLHKGKGGEHQRMGVKVEGEEGEAKEAGKEGKEGGEPVAKKAKT